MPDALLKPLFPLLKLLLIEEYGGTESFSHLVDLTFVSFRARRACVEHAARLFRASGECRIKCLTRRPLRMMCAFSWRRRVMPLFSLIFVLRLPRNQQPNQRCWLEISTSPSAWSIRATGRAGYCCNLMDI
jgi:hypothetical protein